MGITRDIIVIGGSAGAVEGLIRLVPGLPAALAARVFVVVHVPAMASALPSILTRAGHLVARHPADHEATEPSVVYVAPPDRHLLVKPGAVRVLRGPRESGYRPAIDPLFRSAAASHGPRVLCVVLSGSLDDGSAGASAVAAAGGTVLVQDPAECTYPGMPAAALAAVPTATVLPLEEIAPHLLRLMASPVPRMSAECAHDRWRARPVPDPVELRDRDDPAPERSGAIPGLACPACQDGVFEVGGASIEAALWTALHALEDSAEMALRSRDRATDRGSARAAATYAHNADTYEQRARVIRDLLRSGAMAGDAEPRALAPPMQPSRRRP